MDMKKELIERILNLLDEKGVKPTIAAREIGFSNSSFSDWKSGKGSPSTSALLQLSNYLHVSVDYLLKGEEFDKTTSPKYNDEKHLLDTYNSLPKELKPQAIAYIEGLACASGVKDE